MRGNRYPAARRNVVELLGLHLFAKLTLASDPGHCEPSFDALHDFTGRSSRSFSAFPRMDSLKCSVVGMKV